MTKQTKIEAIKEIFQKPDPGQIRIFIQADQAETKVLYKSIEAKGKLDITVLSETEAEGIFNSLVMI